MQKKKGLPELRFVRSEMEKGYNGKLKLVKKTMHGPPPPAVVKEAASANEADRFEQSQELWVDSPYDVIGVNMSMAADSIKKRYWKLSLMVHSDKFTHPEAHQAFIKLNKAFKELQDPVKRKAMDDKIYEKEEKERFKMELKAMREAAQWRRLTGQRVK